VFLICNSRLQKAKPRKGLVSNVRTAVLIVKSKNKQEPIGCRSKKRGVRFWYGVLTSWSRMLSFRFEGVKKHKAKANKQHQVEWE
jgi:hypothetical protein